jgi:plasmid segregation protein ParM
MSTKIKPAVAAAPEQIVRVIDVGFGRVKLSRRAASGGEGDIEFIHFPSMAIPSDPSAMRALGQSSRDTFDVPAAGAMYEVGLDIDLAQTGGDFGRDITDQFYLSPIYEALTKGALRYMGEETIDLLVLGLPVNQYLNSDRREYLEKTYRGEINIGGGKTVEIKEVLVRPQPLGGYIELGNHIDDLNKAISSTEGALEPLEQDADLASLTTLVVDPGEHTTDWLLIRRGQINTKASGAASDAGRHRVVRAVLEALQAKIGRPLGPATMPLINDALRLGKPLKLSGMTYDLAEFEGVIKSAVDDPVSRLIEGVRGMQEHIDIIVIVGGHPDRYRDVLAERFPAIPVFVMADSMMANARGFQIIGEAVLEASADQRKAA